MTLYSVLSTINSTYIDLDFNIQTLHLALYILGSNIDIDTLR